MNLDTKSPGTLEKPWKLSDSDSLTGDHRRSPKSAKSSLRFTGVGRDVVQDADVLGVSRAETKSMVAVRHVSDSLRGEPATERCR